MATLSDITAILEAATPGPWSVDDSNVVGGPDGDSVAVTFGNLAVMPEPVTDADDARAIVTLHNLAPALLAVAQAARAIADHTSEGMSESDAREAYWLAMVALRAALADLDTALEDVP